MTLERLVLGAGWLAAASALLGFGASVGEGVLPELPDVLTVPLHVILFVVGGGSAIAAALRARQLERDRFRWAGEPGATRDEVENAHREAERRLKLVYTALGAAPLALGYWLAYELPETDRLARALPVAPLLGFGFGAILARRFLR